MKSQINTIETLAGEGRLEELKAILGSEYTQNQLDIALCNALSYSRVDTAKYLLSIGADISWKNYEGVYYAVHNNELRGLIFAISHGVSINVNDGMLLNTSVITATNVKDNSILEWLIEEGADLELLSIDMRGVAQRFGSHKLKSMLRI